MKDLLEYIKSWYDSVAERVKMPIFNSFLISWIIVNWKIVLILLFSDASIEARIGMISHIIDSTLLRVYLIPVAMAIAYTFLRPHLLGWIHKKLEKVNFENFSSKVNYSIETSKKRQALISARREEEEIRAGTLNLKSKNDEFEKLKTQLDEKNQRISILSKEVSDSSRNISDLNNEIKRQKESIADALNAKNGALQFYGQISSEIQKVFSFKKQEDVDGYELLQFANNLLYRLHIESNKLEPGRNYLLSTDQRDEARAMGFAEIIKEIRNGNSTLVGVKQDKIAHSMLIGLLFSFEDQNRIFYGLTPAGASLV